MTLSVRIEVNLQREEAFWGGLPTVTRRAASQALTQHARNSLRVQKSTIGQDIDRPNPFTRNSMVSYGASQSRLESGVFVKRQQAEYLARLVGVGANTRNPQNQFIFIPSRQERRDSFGNMSRARRRNVLNNPTLHVVNRGPVGLAYIRQGQRRLFVGSFHKRTRYPRRYWQFYERAQRHYDRTFRATYASVYNRVLTAYSARNR